MLRWKRKERNAGRGRWNHLRLAFLFASLSASLAHADPDLTGAEARAFLGGRTGKIAYLKTSLHQVYFLDLNDSVLIEHKVSDDANCNSPMIHPDGTKIVYESNASVYIRTLEENSQTRTLIYAGVPKAGLALEPHWWINPANGDEYIIFCSGDVSDLTWPPRSGQTYIQKLDKKNYTATGPLQQLLPFQMASGRSKNGLWGATSFHSTGMYKFYADSVANAFFDANNWQDSGGWGACNGSISPSKDPARQNRMMHLNSSLTLPTGESYDNHKAIVIRSWNDPDLSHPIWVMGIPGVRCNNDSSGNQFWDQCEWSTDENYFTAVGSKIIDGYSEADLYVGRINYIGDSQIRRFIKGGGVNHLPHLWIKDGIQPAKIKLGSARLEFTAALKDSVNPAPQTLAITNSGDGVLPPLTLGPLPAWLKISVTGNGTNTPGLSVSVDRSAAAIGVDTATVVMSYGQFADSASFQVKFTYSDPRLTSLVPDPHSAVLLAGESVRLRALPMDQFGKPFATALNATWQAFDGFPIAADGTVQADTVARRQHLFRANLGAVMCTVQVATSLTRLRIDAGAPKDSLPSGWISDEGFAGDAPRLSLPDARVDSSGSPDAAPSAVYRTVRLPTMAYRFDSLPNARYAVRFHFTSPFPGRPLPASGFSISLEGAKILDNVALPARPDSGLRVGTRDLQVTVADGKGLNVELSGPSGSVYLAGLEIHDIGGLPIEVTAPSAGRTYHVGDTLHIKWKADGLINSAGIQFSPDNGKDWIPVTRRSSVNLGQSNWGDYPWVIPDSLDGFSMVSDSCAMMVYDYFGTERDRTDFPFVILASQSNTGLRAHAALAAKFSLTRAGTDRLVIHVTTPGKIQVELISVTGRMAAMANGSGPGDVTLDTRSLPRGVYRLTVTAGRDKAAYVITLLR